LPAWSPTGGSRRHQHFCNVEPSVRRPLPSPEGHLCAVIAWGWVGRLWACAAGTPLSDSGRPVQRWALPWSPLDLLFSPPTQSSSWEPETPAIGAYRAVVCLRPSGRGRRRGHGCFTFKSLGFPVIYRWAYESWPNFKEPPEPFRSFSFSPPRESCMKALKFIYIIMYMPLGFRSKAPEVSNLSQLGP
jgi:hypothetical protein